MFLLDIDGDCKKLLELYFYLPEMSSVSKPVNVGSADSALSISSPSSLRLTVSSTPDLK
jgi:hypothetical protein